MQGGGGSSHPQDSTLATVAAARHTEYASILLQDPQPQEFVARGLLAESFLEGFLDGFLECFLESFI